MSVGNKKKLPGTSRQEEEQHLEEVLQVVQDNVKKYSQEVSLLRTGIDDMPAHFHDDNPELINELENGSCNIRQNPTAAACGHRGDLPFGQHQAGFVK